MYASDIQEKRSNSGNCSIAYGFKACLHRPGILNFDSKAKSELKVLSKPHKTATATPVVVGPESQTVKTCCLYNSGRSVAAPDIHFFSGVYTQRLTRLRSRLYGTTYDVEIFTVVSARKGRLLSRGASRYRYRQKHGACFG